MARNASAARCNFAPARDWWLQWHCSIRFADVYATKSARWHWSASLRTSIADVYAATIRFAEVYAAIRFADVYAANSARSASLRASMAETRFAIRFADAYATKSATPLFAVSFAEHHSDCGSNCR